MHLLAIGASGHVGTLVLPALAAEYDVRVYDLKPPAVSVEYVPGDVTDPEALARAAEGMDLLLYMAMGEFGRGHGFHTAASFDVNVKGVYLALQAAHRAGISHAVYTSSMSVYSHLHGRYFPSEDIPPDEHDIYGFTKRLGEEACRAACHTWGMTVNALRLCLPRADEQWLADTKPGAPTIATTASDVSRALLSALAYRGGGFEAFMISGDYEQTIMNMAKARRLLGWEPLARPRQPGV